MLACTAAFFVFVLVYTTSIQALLDPYASSSQLDRMEEKLENFQTKFDLCEKQIGLLNNTINNKQGTQTVAFTAFLKNSLSNIPANQVIIFEDILTNVGGAYDKNDGHFQAPVTGTYIFFLTLTSLSNKQAALWLMKDGNYIARVLAHSNDPTEYETVTMATVVSMAAGERVWIQNVNFQASYGGLDGNHWTQFSGHLIV